MDDRWWMILVWRFGFFNCLNYPDPLLLSPLSPSVSSLVFPHLGVVEAFSFHFGLAFIVGSVVWFIIWNVNYSTLRLRECWSHFQTIWAGGRWWDINITTRMTNPVALFPGEQQRASEKNHEPGVRQTWCVPVPVPPLTSFRTSSRPQQSLRVSCKTAKCCVGGIHQSQ